MKTRHARWPLPRPHCSQPRPALAQTPSRADVKKDTAEANKAGPDPWHRHRSQRQHRAADQRQVGRVARRGEEGNGRRQQGRPDPGHGRRQRAAAGGWPAVAQGEGGHLRHDPRRRARRPRPRPTRPAPFRRPKRRCRREEVVARQPAAGLNAARRSGAAGAARRWPGRCPAGSARTAPACRPSPPHPGRAPAQSMAKAGTRKVTAIARAGPTRAISLKYST